MGRLTPVERKLASKMRKEGVALKVIVSAFQCSRQTIWYWSGCFLKTMKNLPRVYKSKISIEAEITILFLRSLGYGCARIKQRLESAPEIERCKTEIFVQGLIVSRQSVYKVLKKHKLNGYKNKEQKVWKFFRAKCPNELWQLDMKEFKFEGRKYYFIVCIDDFSRNLLCLKLLGHSPNIPEICQAISAIVEKYHPQKILTDNNPFKESWKVWCKEQGVEAIFAHPYYPQDKGKVERTNRNIAEELVNLILIFHKILNEEEIEKGRKWFNEERFNNGIKDYPANLYVKY